MDDGIVAKRADEACSEPGPSGRGTLIVNLSTVMLGGLVLFRSHADCERVCRLVTTNNAQYCASPSADMPSSLVTRKAMMAAKDNVCVCVSHGESTSKRQVCHLKSPSCKMQVPATPEH